MNNEINVYLSKRNRRAILVLSFLMIIIIFSPRLYFYFLPESKAESEGYKIVESIRKNNKIFKHQFNFRDKTKQNKYKIPIKKFDPNVYTIYDWMNLGLSEKQAKVILKYTKNGVYSNLDLKRIFVISDELFNLIKDSTFYPQKNNKTLNFETNSMFTRNELVEINEATEDQLINLRGVGAFFSKQILKKRSELGGFVKVEQLLEVWKMDRVKFDEIKLQIYIDESKVSKIKLNSVSVEDLKKHPYIRWNIANSIIKIRDQKNGFSNINEIKESFIINDELFEKLKPYLSL